MTLLNLVGAIFGLLCIYHSAVDSHHIQGIPGAIVSQSYYPCQCGGPPAQTVEAGGGGDPCSCGDGGGDEGEGGGGIQQGGCGGIKVAGGNLLSCADCSNNELECAGNLEKCCLPNGLCGCPDPCNPSQCRPMGSTSLFVHDVTVATFSYTKIKDGENTLKCDPESNSLMCCKDSYCAKLPDVSVDPQAMNTVSGTLCVSGGKSVVQYYANVTEVILLWAFGRERDGIYFGDIVGEVITKLLGRTPNLPFY